MSVSITLHKQQYCTQITKIDKRHCDTGVNWLASAAAQPTLLQRSHSVTCTKLPSLVQRCRKSRAESEAHESRMRLASRVMATPALDTQRNW